MLIPKISIIMAVYNGEKYLRLAINSVLQQDFIDYEFIIVDDCSNDSTATIISSYEDERIKYIKNKVNLGQTPSLNIGLSLAKGKYIARIDADDIYLPEKLEKQFNFMENNSNVVVCGTNGLKIDDNGEIIGTYSVPQKSKDLLFHILYGSPIIHVSVLMRRSIIIANGGYNEEYPYCADFALWSKLITNKYNVLNLPLTLIKFRLFDGSLGVAKKLGPSGKEATDIIYSNITELSNISISKKECEAIILMLWPEAGHSIDDLTNAYLKLISLAKELYNSKIPFRALIIINKHYLKSLVKRGLYYKSQSQIGMIKKDYLMILKSYLNKPMLSLMVIISLFIILFISKKHINNIKRLFPV